VRSRGGCPKKKDVGEKGTNRSFQKNIHEEVGRNISNRSLPWGIPKKRTRKTTVPKFKSGGRTLKSKWPKKRPGSPSSVTRRELKPSQSKTHRLQRGHVLLPPEEKGGKHDKTNKGLWGPLGFGGDKNHGGVKKGKTMGVRPSSKGGKKKLYGAGEANTPFIGNLRGQ